MKKQVYGAVLAAAMVFGMTAFAQDQQQSAPADQTQQQGKWGGHGHRGMKGKMDSQARLDRMSQKLNLTDDQKTKIKPILENENQQLQSLRSDTSTAQADKKSKAMDIHKSTMDQIRPILNSDQQAKLEKMQANAKERAGKRHRGQQSGSQSTPKS